MPDNISKWGPLEQRYTYKQNEKRKILSLDGGGIRGLLTLEMLLEMQRQLQKELNKGDEFCLADYFDYIGGTSTGAIIAAGLARGWRVETLLDFYKHKGRAMFRKNFRLLKFLYRSGPLTKALKETFGENDIDLKNGDYKCLLLVVTMNRSTDSPWPISNNPNARYNDALRADCNLRVPLYKLVRASTAAPIYFGPEIMQWDPNKPEKKTVFVDGGVTPYNNPSFLLYRMATQDAYKLNWKTGEDNLLIVSVGTGSAPTEGKYRHIFHALKTLPVNLMFAMQADQDINCRMIGRCTYGAHLENELRDMIPLDANNNIVGLGTNLQRHFLYVRYNADLSKKGIEELKIGPVNIKRIRKIDSIRSMNDLQKVGAAAGKQQINVAKHFGSFI